jgi:hypothetical protein
MTATIKKRAAKSGGKVTGRLSGKAIELPEGTWERIRQKAYELWVARGGGEGEALRDWLEAEEIVMEEIHEARE